MTSGPTSDVDALQERLESLEERRSLLGRLAERAGALRDQVTEIASRDRDLSASHEELNQHVGGLAGELQSLVQEQLTLAAAEEERAARILAGFQERARELTRREKELEAGVKVSAARAEGLAAREEAVARDAAETKARAEEIAKRERGLAETDERITIATARHRDKERELDERERAVQAEASAAARRSAELDAQEKRIAELATREQARGAELERLAAATAEREQELEQRSAAVAAREKLADRFARPSTAPMPVSRGLSIQAIEQAVAARRADFPDRAAEWDAYLFQLREQAGPDGILPQSLTGLVEDVFAPLL